MSNDTPRGLGYRSRLRCVPRGRGSGRSVAVVMALAAPADQAGTEDRIRMVLASLVRERRDLRRRGGDRAALEANRMGIIYWQRELSKRS